MIYLQDNPLLREPLKAEHIKNRLLEHWGASPSLAFTYIHLNRLIKKYDLDMICLAGRGAPGVLAPVYLEGAYSEIYTDKSEDEEGPRGFCKQFSFPGGHPGLAAHRKHPVQSTKGTSSDTYSMRTSIHLIRAVRCRLEMVVTRHRHLVVEPGRVGSMPKFMALHEHDRLVTY